MMKLKHEPKKMEKLGHGHCRRIDLIYTYKDHVKYYFREAVPTHSFLKIYFWLQ